MDRWWLKDARVIRGSYFQKMSEVAFAAANVRSGDLWVCGSIPLEFAGWITPLKFVVKSNEVRFTIERQSRGVYELTDARYIR